MPSHQQPTPEEVNYKTTFAAYLKKRDEIEAARPCGHRKHFVSGCTECSTAQRQVEALRATLPPTPSTYPIVTLGRHHDNT